MVMTGRAMFSTLHTLQLVSTTPIDTLNDLIQQIKKCPQNALILAPEVAVTDFSYQQFEEAALLSATIDKEMLELCETKTIVLTLIEKQDTTFFNVAKVYHKNAIVHTQAKYNLFTLGDESKYFTPASTPPHQIVEIDDVKIAVLICFELRFTQYWEIFKGADIILIPARWGKLRSEHFKTLTKALAIANQCYVMACDSANDDCTNYQAVLSPFGEQFLLETRYNANEITKMRRYLNTGIPLG